MGELHYRRLERGDIGSLCELFYEVFGDGKGVDYWQWKYFDNPFGEHASIVAVDGGRVAGILGGVPVMVQMGKEQIPVCQGVDTVIAAEYRRSSTFFKLEQAVAEEMVRRRLAFRYAFTIKETYGLYTGGRGFQGVCPIYKMSKVIDPTPYLDDKVGVSLLANLFGGMAKGAISRWSRKTISIPQDLELFEIVRFDEHFDDFWHEQAQNHEIAVARTSDYLNWRYVDAPQSYKIYGIRSDAAVKGFIVVGCYREEVYRGRILDIMVDEGQKEVLGLLITRALNYFVENEVDAVTCWMLEGWPAFHALQERGFVPRETPHDLIVRSYFPEKVHNEYLAESSRWYITMGDSDYY